MLIRLSSTAIAVLFGVSVIATPAITKALPNQYHSSSNWIAQTDNLSLSKASQLIKRGNQQYHSNQWAAAILLWEEAVPLFFQAGDQASAAKMLGNIGVAHKKLGQYELALAKQQQALKLNRDLQDLVREAKNLTNIGNLYDLLGRYSEALKSHQQSLLVARKLNDPEAELRALTNRGIVHKHLGDYEEALASYQESLDLLQSLDSPADKSKIFNNIGEVYRLQGNYNSALESYELSLGIKAQLEDHLGEAATLSNIGGVYQLSGRLEQALDVHQKSLAIRRELGDRAGTATSLNNLGALYQQLGNETEALVHFHQSLAIADSLDYRAATADILSNIGILYEAQGEAELATVFLKKSVNQYEAIRAHSQSLSSELQSTYTVTVASTYRNLAALLLRQDRVLEAQRVLDLLKVQEAQDYLGIVRGNARTASGVDFVRTEQEILEHHAVMQGSAIRVAQSLAELQQKDVEEGFLNAEDTETRRQLTHIQEDLLEQFNGFAETPEIKAFLTQINRIEANSALPLNNLNALRSNLAKLNAVLVYPLVLEDRIELVITTPHSVPLRRTIYGVGRGELDDAIARFRQALEDPQSNAKAPAYQLYRWLIAPLEADLAEAQAKTILYAPDGPLRYIPLSALYDSAEAEQGQWLAERFQVNNITATSLQQLTVNLPQKPRVLAGAFADASVVHTVEVGDRTLQFPGLPFAGIEVRALANILPNIRTYIDDEFSLSTLKPQLSSFNIIHFATHASLVPKSVGDSFILFGNGDKARIKDIKNWPIFNVDLVVLSACETGLGGLNNNGEQILGLGYQFHRQGVKAVIASLWQVNDGSTQTLMNAFYLAIRNGYSKAEALQRAQQALLQNNWSLVSQPRGEERQQNAESEVGILNDLSHPHYWAPFILIGNGL